MAKKTITRTAPKSVELPNEEQVLRDAIADNFAAFPEEVREAMQESAMKKIKEIESEKSKAITHKQARLNTLNALMSAYFDKKDAADAAKKQLDTYFETNRKLILGDAKSIVTEEGSIAISTEKVIATEHCRPTLDEVISFLTDPNAASFVKKSLSKSDFEKLLITKSIVEEMVRTNEAKELSNEAELLYDMGIVGYIEKETISIRRATKE